MFSSKKIITLITMVIVIAACSKNNDKPKSKTELLTIGTWKLMAATFHGDSDGNGSIEDVDLFSIFPDCAKDDVTTYYPDGDALNEEGPTRCDPTIPETYEFNWEFKENETKLNTGGKDFIILELTSTTLKYIIPDPYGTGFNEYKATVTYSH